MKLRDDDILTDITNKFAQKKNDFPRNGSLDYPALVGGWMKNLQANAFPYVTAGGIAIDGGHLTMHDGEHVGRVAQVAANLIGQADTLELTPYELTLLLVAIQLHDIGNVLGRAGHEKNILKAVQAAGAQLNIDAVEFRAAREIAGVHGGKIGGNKDTISTLPDKQAVYGQQVRPRLLAAILRLADELADDPARANKVQMAAGVLPPEAQVFHVVAAALHSQMPEASTREIRLDYNFSDASVFKAKLGKGAEKVHLLDEIFERSLKTYHEARYCSRFTRPWLEFERVHVDIIIFDEDQRQLHRIRYSIAERGYGDQHKSIYEMVPELAAYNGNGRLTASHLWKLIRAAQGAQG